MKRMLDMQKLMIATATLGLLIGSPVLASTADAATTASDMQRIFAVTDNAQPAAALLATNEMAATERALAPVVAGAVFGGVSGGAYNVGSHFAGGGTTANFSWGSFAFDVAWGASGGSGGKFLLKHFGGNRRNKL
jgi:hypothetical protein